MAPTSIDGNEITGATIDGQDVSEITVDGQTVFTAIPDSAVHRFKFDEGTGTAKDSIGNKSIDIPESAWVSGADFQGGFAVDLTGETINTGEVYSVFEANNFTLSSTLKVDVPNNNGAALEQHPDFVYGHESSGFGGNLTYRVDPISFSDGVNYSNNTKGRFVAATDFNSGSATLYINSTQRSDGGGLTDRNNSSNFILGSGRDNDFAGIIDDLIIYDSVLTQEEVDQDFQAQPWS